MHDACTRVAMKASQSSRVAWLRLVLISPI
ncbi:hypothetical protein BRAS3843_1780048 [Bradyrhizobium sp. STM 3843]|nr:hypothetical protein BRAS3843_1780048 [Bradyrhizobium sp. STM 3843]